MNDIFLLYHKCQFVLKSRHTLLTYNSHYSSTRHSNRMTYSMFDILFIYNTYKYIYNTIQVLIKEKRSPHSWCHYTNFQKGAAPLSSAWPSGFIIGQRANNPTPESSVELLTPLCWRPSPPPTHIPLTTLHPCCLYPPRVLTKGTLLLRELP